MDILETLKLKRIYSDGANGSMLQKMGIQRGEASEDFNIKNPEKVKEVHLSYLSAGANIITTNTFCANRFKMSTGLSENINAALLIAKSAKEEYPDSFIGLDIGPTGRMLAPLGDLKFEDAVSVFAEIVNIGKRTADFIMIETMTDLYETKAALLAAKENCDLPVFVSNAYDKSGRLLTGATPEAVIATLEGLGADVIGINCSFGPLEMGKIVDDYIKYSSLPIIVSPNAGLPEEKDGKTFYSLSADKFSECMKEMAKKGVSVLGGCCGTTPEYIEKTVLKTKDIPLQKITKKNYTVISSYGSAVSLGEKAVLIGERINPTGKKRFKEALRENDTEYILNVGLGEEEAGAEVLDVNVGLPEIDEAQMLKSITEKLQEVTSLPLQLDTSDPIALESALRIYNGKALINSVNGKEESMKSVFPIAKKYGGVIVALTLDESGIPQTADGRVKIAEKIIETAAEYGIDKKDIIVDPLTLTVSADKSAAAVTLKSLKLIKEKLGVCTSLGVSNVSFGLPKREYINASFFSMALLNGLSAAIMNPLSAEMMKAYRSSVALLGQDESFSDYISFAESTETLFTSSSVKTESGEAIDLKTAIIKGLKESASKFAKEELKKEPPMTVINDMIIPALDTVGKGFEEKTVFLPSLLLSAAAAANAFEEVKVVLSKDGETEKKGKIILATVKGDIHDIGKNIVKVLLQNYGFDVLDLGRDVAPEKIVETAIKEDVKLVGLSALMTTTVPSMAETIKLLKAQKPDCKTVVGGAVLTAEYAQMIGADKYCKDAMETVRFAEEFFK